MSFKPSVCDADDCKNNNREKGECKLLVNHILRLHCQDYSMDKPYLDAQLKDKLRDRKYVFPAFKDGVLDKLTIRTKEELDATYKRNLLHHNTPPEKAGEEEKKNAKNNS